MPYLLVEDALKNGVSGFGTVSENNGHYEEIETPFGKFIIPGNGTFIDQKNKLMWTRAPWGMSWVGYDFFGNPVSLDWKQATTFFGRGIKIKGWKNELRADMRNLKPELISDSSKEKGYTPGACRIEFASYADWRIPTCMECYQTLLFGETGFKEKGNIFKEYRLTRCELLSRLFHPTISFDTASFWTANERYSDDLMSKMFGGGDSNTAWLVHPSKSEIRDANSGSEHYLLFVRNL